MSRKIPFHFNVRCDAGDAPAEISIRGTVGSYYNSETYSMSDTEEDVLSELGKIPAGKKINVRINSLGGNFALALGCYNAMSRRSADITTFNEGFACSAGSILFAVGSRRVSPPSSVVMVHCAAGGMEGNAADARKYAETLDACDKAMAAIYAKAAGGTPEEWLEKMKSETWMTGTEAVTAKLATDSGDEDIQMDSEPDADAKQVVSTFKNIPKNLQPLLVKAQAKVIPPMPPTNTNINTMKKVIDALVAAGFTVQADANEDAVAMIISRDVAPIKSEIQKHIEARKTRVTAAIETAIAEKILSESRKTGLLALGSASAEGEAEIMAQIADIRAAKVTSQRGAKPVPHGGDSGETIESLLAEQAEAVSSNDAEALAAVNAKLAEKRGRKDLFAPAAERPAYTK